jgi:hypothetical protein
MENLTIKGEKNTFFIPNVEFSADSGVCALHGESYLEDTFSFYQRLENWLNEFTSSIKKPIIFNIGLSYFNTASSRSILDLLMLLKQYQEQGGDVTVNWTLQNWDDDMKQEIEDFSADSGLIINVAG